MTESEPMIQCPKGCGTSLPLSQMHEHYESCTGKPIKDIIPIWPTQSSIPKAPDTLPPIEIEKPKSIKEEIITPTYCKKCGTQYIITSLYRACTKCQTLNVRKRFFWFLMLRYGLMIAGLALSVGFIWGIYSYHKIFG